jgi:hypothetical protein
MILFEGRIAELANIINETPISAVITALPRPNQAYWTLCALWAGWLWGSESAEPFHLVLRRRRYDWSWHLEALQAAFHHLFDLLKLDTPCLTLVPEPEPGFLTAALAAGDINSFYLKSLAMRTQDDAVQIVWTRGVRLHHKLAEVDMDSVREAIRDHLIARGEPTLYLPLQAAALSVLKMGHALVSPDHPLDDVIRNAGNTIQEALLGDKTFVRYGGGENVETGLWGLSQEIKSAEPLSDRVEMAVVNYLIEHPNCEFENILHDLSPRFPGLLTPPLGLVQEVLTSYGEQVKDKWKLRREDWPSARKEELIQIANLLETIGERLDYRTNRLDERTLVWEAGETSEYVFHLKASAILDRALIESPYPRQRSLMVIPDMRVSLLDYKIRRDPALAAFLEGLRVMKFHLVRALAEQPMVDKLAFEAQMKGDTGQERRGQLRLL